MRLAFIGGGIMAEAIISGVLQGEIANPNDLIIGEPITSRSEYLAQNYKVRTTGNNRDAINEADLVILATKPQILGQILDELCGHLGNSQTVVSIIAGTKLATLVKGLDHQPAIRVMPNTPAQIGAGMSVWTSTKQVSEQAREWTKIILHTLGKEIEVDDEKYLDMSTAINGSGPAYVFTFAEALIDAAVHIGLNRTLARDLVLQTLYGSAKLLLQSDIHPAELRNRVTSPGGTTAEALLELEQGGFRATIMNAVAAAYEKSLAIGDGR
jgi:pyrroline-5-carboxylate reductase